MNWEKSATSIKILTILTTSLLLLPHTTHAFSLPTLSISNISSVFSSLFSTKAPVQKQSQEPTQEYIEGMIQRNLLAQAVSAQLTQTSTTQATTQAPTNTEPIDREALKQEILREIRASLPTTQVATPLYTSLTPQNTETASLRREIATLRSLITRQSDSDTSSHSITVNNITNSGSLTSTTLTNPTVTGATITGSSFSGSGTFTSLSSSSGTFSSLTSGRIPYSSTGGLLADSSSLTYDSSSNTLTTTNLIGTNATTTNLYSTTASSTNLFSSLLNIGSNALVVNSSRNIGIGTTDIEAWHSAYRVIETDASSLMMPVAATGELNIIHNAYNDGSWKYKTTSAASHYAQRDGTHSFKVSPPGTADTAIAWTTALAIDNSGNVTLLQDKQLRLNGSSAYFTSPATNLIYVSTGGAPRYQFENDRFSPLADNLRALGGASLRWTAVYATNGTIQTSDERAKTTIQDSDLGLDFIRLLRPVSYKWREGGDTNSTNYGIIAQELEEVLGGRSFGGLLHDQESDMYGLNYSQLISPIIKSIQEIDIRLSDLEGASSPTASSTVTVTDSSSFLDTLLWAGMQLFQNSVEFVAVTAQRLTVGELRVTEKVCADDVCVTKDQFKALLESAGGTASVVQSSPVVQPTATTTATSTAQTATTTEPVVTPTQTASTTSPTATSTAPAE